MPEFSDPAWWPKPPPKLPTTVSLQRIVFLGLVPLLVAGALVVLVHERRGHPAAATGHPVAAVGSCTPSRAARPAPARSRSAARARTSCAALVPSVNGIADFAPAHGRAGQFGSCLEGATGKTPGEARAGGSSTRLPAAILRAAVAVCESLSREHPARPPARTPGALPAGLTAERTRAHPGARS